MGMLQGPWRQGLRETKGGQSRREEKGRPQGPLNIAGSQFSSL